MKSLLWPFVLCALATSACVVAADAGPGPAPGPVDGAFSFDWSFDGDPSCVSADVSDLDVVVSDAQTGDVIVDDRAEPCTGSGLTITAIPEGTVNVDLTAFDPRGNAIYAGGFTVDIVAGTTADVGVVDLASPSPPGPGPG